MAARCGDVLDERDLDLGIRALPDVVGVAELLARVRNSNRPRGRGSFAAGTLAALLVLCGIIRAQEPIGSVGVSRAAVCGTLVDLEGKPVALVPLALVPPNLVDELWGNDARAWCKLARTSSDGTFLFADVGPGAYHVCVLLSERVEPVTSTPLRPGDTAELVLRRRRLCVRIVDSDGARAPTLVSESAHWPVRIFKPGVECVELTPGRTPRHPLPVLAADDEHVQYVVEQGATYVVSYVASDPYLAAVERSLRIDAITTECELWLSAPATPGMLAIDVRDPDGGKFEPHGNQLELCTVLSGRPLASIRSESTLLEPRRSKFAPGPYFVRANDDELQSWCASHSMSKLARWNPVEQPVRVVSGETARVELRFLRGARLELDLALDAELAARKLAEWSRRFPTLWRPPSVGWLELGPRGPAACVQLRSIDAREECALPIDVEFFHPELLFGWHELGLLPGTRALAATLVPTGRYELTVEHADFDRFTTTVDMRADETTSVRAKLVERSR